MRYKFVAIALIAAIPSVVLAGANFLNHDPVYTISLQDPELGNRVERSITNYRLVWNPEIGKFDILPGSVQRPIDIENTLHPEAIDSEPFEPIYYGTDISV